MADQIPNPSEFTNAMSGLQLRLIELQGRACRNTTTVTTQLTLASAMVPGLGRIAGFRMKALDTGTTSSTTFNTVALFKIPFGSITATAISTLRTNRGSNGAVANAGFNGATALVNPGDLLVIRRLTKLNIGSQLFVSCEVNKEVK